MSRVSFSAKRKSAVELLQETKSLYVKSETVLDRKQELRRSLRSSGSSDKGSSSHDVTTSGCYHYKGIYGPFNTRCTGACVFCEKVRGRGGKREKKRCTTLTRAISLTVCFHDILQLTSMKFSPNVFGSAIYLGILRFYVCINLKYFLNILPTFFILLQTYLANI